MTSVFLLSMVLCVIFTPLLLAKLEDPKRGLRLLLMVVITYNIIYGIGLYFSGAAIQGKLTI